MAYELGEMEQTMGADLMERLDDVRNQCQKYRFPYYMLVYATKLGNQVFTKILTMRHDKFKELFPVPMFGTIALRVDNKKGETKVLWCLPRDLPLDPNELTGQVVESVAKQAFALGMPIINA